MPGTDAYFVDLNRDRPHVGPAVSFSIVPTVHTRGSETVFASLTTQAEVVAQARRLFAAEVDVSPVTWTLHGDPEGRHDAERRATGSPADPGLLGPDGSTRPVFHALAALADGSTDRSAARAVGTPGSPWVGLQLIDLGRLVIASLRPWPRLLDLRALRPPPTCRRLVERHLAAAGRTHRWWGTGPVTPLDDPAAVALEPFEISVFDGRR